MKIVDLKKFEGVFCSHCHSKKYHKNATEKGTEKDFLRYWCKDCRKNFTMKPKKYSLSIKLFAVYLYLNMGIRKIAKLFGVYSSTVLRWIRQVHKNFKHKFNPVSDGELDTIEFDELYTFIKKGFRPDFPYGLLIHGDSGVLLRLR